MYNIIIIIHVSTIIFYDALICCYVNLIYLFVDYLVYDHHVSYITYYH
jgi:hypothetical protein